MTKEEIINGLKMSMELTLFDPSTGEVMEPYQLNDINRTAYEAYKGAVELLEKQPDITTHDSIPAETGKNDGDGTSGDCISRQQAIDALCKSECGCSNAECRHKDGADFCVTCDNVKIINSLPYAQPERKTGRWIESNPQDSKVCRLMTCSECGKAYIVNINIPYEDWTEAHKFCIECGADMRGETE